jgi:hypothetical protein
MTEWASATKFSQVVPTENPGDWPRNPGDELLLRGQALIYGICTMKKALGVNGRQYVLENGRVHMASFWGRPRSSLKFMRDAISWA